MGNAEAYGQFVNPKPRPGTKNTLIQILTRREVYLPVIVALLLVLASAVTVGYVKSCFFPAGRYQALRSDNCVTVIDTQTGTTRTFVVSASAIYSSEDLIVDFDSGRR